MPTTAPRGCQKDIVLGHVRPDSEAFFVHLRTWLGGQAVGSQALPYGTSTFALQPPTGLDLNPAPMALTAASGSTGSLRMKKDTGVSSPTSSVPRPPALETATAGVGLGCNNVLRWPRSWWEPGLPGVGGSGPGLSRARAGLQQCGGAGALGLVRRAGPRRHGARGEPLKREEPWARQGDYGRREGLGTSLGREAPRPALAKQESLGWVQSRNRRSSLDNGRDPGPAWAG